MKVRIKNLQKVKKIKITDLRKNIGAILTSLEMEDSSVDVVLCETSLIRQINKQYLKRDRATDVIAFFLKDTYLPGFLGEVFVSVEEAVGKCAEYSMPWEKELFLYIVHGILHLAGYDDHTPKDIRKMRKKEQELLKLVCPEKL